MRYVESRFKQYEREEIYRIYVTDSLKVFGDFSIRYVDLFGEKEERTGEEIISTIQGKLAKIGGETE